MLPNSPFVHIGENLAEHCLSPAVPPVAVKPPRAPALPQVVVHSPPSHGRSFPKIREYLSHPCDPWPPYLKAPALKTKASSSQGR